MKASLIFIFFLFHFLYSNSSSLTRLEQLFNIDIETLPKTHYINKIFEGFLKGLYVNHSLSDFCENTSFDAIIEGFLINAGKHLLQVKNFGELNKTFEIIKKSLSLLMKGTLKGCDIDLAKISLKKPENLIETLNEAVENMKEIEEQLDEIRNSANSENIAEKIGHLLGVAYKVFVKNSEKGEVLIERIKKNIIN